MVLLLESTQFFIEYKNCVPIFVIICFICFICSSFKNCVRPVQWRKATEVYIPKSGSPDPNDINDFRPMSLLNVKGKFFFSILSKRLEEKYF